MRLKKIVAFFAVTVLFYLALRPAYALSTAVVSSSPSPSGLTVSNQPTPEASASAFGLPVDQIKPMDITNPQESSEDFAKLFEKRPISRLSPFNFIAFTVQYAVQVGIPANTVMLILLLPVLATIVAFFRHLIGLPSLDMIVPIALSVTLVSTGLTAGGILLFSIILASVIGRIILKSVRIMQVPKKALSVLIVAIFVFLTLTVSAASGILVVKQISIFPILILVLLGERIMSLQLARSLRETVFITSVTLILGITGFLILTSTKLSHGVLLYPEFILLLIPVNLLIGRYFGLRLTEFVRFSQVRKNGSK